MPEILARNIVLSLPHDVVYAAVFDLGSAIHKVLKVSSKKQFFLCWETKEKWILRKITKQYNKIKSKVTRSLFQFLFTLLSFHVDVCKFYHKNLLVQAHFRIRKSICTKFKSHCSTLFSQHKSKVSFSEHLANENNMKSKYMSHSHMVLSPFPKTKQ